MKKLFLHFHKNIKKEDLWNSQLTLKSAHADLKLAWL